MNTVFTTATPEFSDWVQDQRKKIGLGFRHIVRDADGMQGAKFGEPAFNWICWQRIERIKRELDAMQDGQTLIMLDADVILFEPLANIVDIAHQVMDADGTDIVAQHDPDTGACCGFMLIRKTAETVKHVARWAKGATLSHNDQIGFNSLRLPTSLLSSRIVASYGNLCLGGGVWSGQKFDMLFQPMAFHANYCIGIEDKRRLRDYVRSLLPVVPI